MKNLKGVITALVTPFDGTGRVDYDAMNRLVDFQLNEGVAGLVVCGTTGEAATLSPIEYNNIIGNSIERVAGRVPVIIGTGTNNTQTTISNCQLAEKLGVDAVLVVAPYYNKPTRKGLLAHFKAVNDSINIPIIIYNVPGRTASTITPELVLEMANNLDNVIAVKEASGSMTAIMQILKDRPKGFNVYSGDDSLTYAITALGGEGCISVASNMIPKDFSTMVHAIQEGNLPKALHLHEKYLDWMEKNFIETNPIPIKTALSWAGFIQEEFRLPLCQLEYSNKQKYIAELEKLFDINDYTERRSRAAVRLQACG